MFKSKKKSDEAILLEFMEKITLTYLINNFSNVFFDKREIEIQKLDQGGYNTCLFFVGRRGGNKIYWRTIKV